MNNTHINVDELANLAIESHQLSHDLRVKINELIDNKVQEFSNPVRISVKHVLSQAISTASGSLNQLTKVIIDSCDDGKPGEMICYAYALGMFGVRHISLNDLHIADLCFVLKEITNYPLPQ